VIKLLNKLFGKSDGFAESDKNNTAENTVLSDEFLNDIKEAIKTTVYSGFFSDSELYGECEQIIEDMCLDYDEPMPSKELVRKLTDNIISERNSLHHGDNFIQLAKAFDELTAEGVIALHNAGYTMDEGFDSVDVVFSFMKENEIPRNGWCFYHTQDMERAIDPEISNLCIAFGSTYEDSEKTVFLGERISDCLNSHGFKVKWNKTSDTRIIIEDFRWDKVYDGCDYSLNRAVRIMQKTFL